MPDRGDRSAEQSLSDLLTHHMSQKGLSLSALSAKSGVSKATIHRWLTGKSVHPYHRGGLLSIAVALGLPRVNANRLLLSAGFPTIDVIAESDDTDEVELLGHWSAAIPNNLPAKLTSFVGRIEETSEIADRLCRDDVRLVTLVGAGGTGKTRLALRVAEEILDVFPDGVFFVSLASVTSTRFVNQTIAGTIGIRDALDFSLDARLRNWLRSRKVLLILDNLEQLREIGLGVVDLLRSAPGLKILATSRIPIHVSGEHVWTVHPFPRPSSSLPVHGLRRHPAVDLFLIRGAAVSPRHISFDEDLPAIAEICARVDGLPLAIELAAARTRDRDPRQLLSDFPNSLELASRGPHDLPRRQQTLRDTIAWSFDLLPNSTKLTFLRLTVFVGGWTLDAANAVCAVGRESIDETAETLKTLCDANLIERAPSKVNTSRYRMLETIREYGLERRLESGEDLALCRRHATYLLNLAEAAPPYVPEAALGDWYKQIESDEDNIRAALDWADSHGEIQTLARFVAALWPYWMEYHRVREGRRWAEVVMAHGDSIPDRVRASVLTGFCNFAWMQTDFRQAREQGEIAMALWQRLGDHRGQALVARQLGGISNMSGQAGTAIDLFNMAVREWRLVGDETGIAYALSDLALALIMARDLEAAIPFLEEAKDLHVRLGDDDGIARSMRDRGTLALLSEELVSATSLLGKSVDRFRRTGRKPLLAGAIFYLGTAQCFSGLLDEAWNSFAESLNLHEETGDVAGVSLALLGLAALANRQGDDVRAATLCGAAKSMRHLKDVALPHAAKDIYDREIAEVLRHLGEETFSQAFALGAEMTTVEAIAFAREVLVT